MQCSMDVHALQTCALCLQMEPEKGAGFLAMYEAMGGKVSTA